MKEQVTKKPETKVARKRIAIIRIKGKTGIRKELQDTLKMLRLYRKNHCVVISNDRPYIGMIQKIDHLTTWGEIDEETFKLLLEKRGRLPGNQIITEKYIKEKTKSDLNSFSKDFMSFTKELKDIPGLKNFFKLSPPKGGFETKGVKTPYSAGGVLGYRKTKINDLIKRMI